MKTTLTLLLIACMAVKGYGQKVPPTDSIDFTVNNTIQTRSEWASVLSAKDKGIIALTFDSIGEVTISDTTYNEILTKTGNIYKIKDTVKAIDILLDVLYIQHKGFDSMSIACDIARYMLSNISYNTQTKLLDGINIDDPKQFTDSYMMFMYYYDRKSFKKMCKVLQHKNKY